jgi:hypothetical protein
MNPGGGGHCAGRRVHTYLPSSIIRDAMEVTNTDGYGRFSGLSLVFGSRAPQELHTPAMKVLVKDRPTSAT